MIRRLQTITIPTPPIAFALRACRAHGYGKDDLAADPLAGVTVGIVAIPLALAIASGVPPQHGLYTAIVGGLILAVTGGSMKMVDAIITLKSADNGGLVNSARSN